MHCLNYPESSSLPLCYSTLTHMLSKNGILAISYKSYKLYREINSGNEI